MAWCAGGLYPTLNDFSNFVSESTSTFFGKSLELTYPFSNTPLIIDLSTISSAIYAWVWLPTPVISSAMGWYELFAPVWPCRLDK